MSKKAEAEDALVKLVLATVSMESLAAASTGSLGAGAAVAALCELTGREGADDALKRVGSMLATESDTEARDVSRTHSARTHAPPPHPPLRPLQAATVALALALGLAPGASLRSCVAAAQARASDGVAEAGLLRGEAAQELMQVRGRHCHCHHHLHRPHLSPPSSLLPQRLGAHDASSALSSLDRLDAQQRDYKRIFARFEQQMKGFSNVSEELAMMSEWLGGGAAGGGTGYEADIYPGGAVGAAGEAVDALEAELAAARAAEEVRSAGARAAEEVRGKLAGPK